MTKSFKIRIGAALTALCLAGATLPAAAHDNLPARTISALGIAIATQGDAALEQIREELKDSLLEQIKPFLPKPEASTDPKSAEAAARQ